MYRRSIRLLVAIAWGVAGCAGGSGGSHDERDARTPLFGNLGRHHRPVTTSSKEAHKYFDQGLALTFAFNHDEAIRSDEEVARLDSNCAMAYWGIALANGPHINNPVMDEARSRAAWAALMQAREKAGGATETERALIEALGKRYADPPPENRQPLDQAYAEAMRAVWRAHPEDADIGTLFAEAMMDLRPWDLWTPEGAPQPGTEEIVTTLETVMRLQPEHPGANHLYIHAIEASPDPTRALTAADRLRSLVPGAGHLVHMPAHIYCRVGRWHDAAIQNEQAIRADEEYRKQSPKQGFYRIYMAHNHHFLSWTCQMEGRSADAIRAARDMIAGIPPEFLRESAFFADGYMTIEIESLMRFGRWNDILALPEPPEYLPITAAWRHFARGVSLTALGRLDEALTEQRAFEAASQRITEDMVVGNNKATHTVSIARHLLNGEILARWGKIDPAVADLRKAVELEDALRYNEAPDWIQPVRHALGAVLVRAGRFKEAERVYRDDLARLPENGWSLQGLAQCLRARKAVAEADSVEARFQKAWARADVKIQTSCFCQAPPS